MEHIIVQILWDKHIAEKKLMFKVAIAMGFLILAFWLLLFLFGIVDLIQVKVLLLLFSYNFWRADLV